LKAMIFAAGRGERMRPLTDTCPKPLLKVRGRPLIVWQILNLVRAGITDIVINHSHLGNMIEEALGDGRQFGASVAYSPEAVPLETAGGIAQARHLLGEAPFLAVSGDIYCPHFNFEQVKSALEDNDVWGNPHPGDKRDVAWLYLVMPNSPEITKNQGLALRTGPVSTAALVPRLTDGGVGCGADFCRAVLNDCKRRSRYFLLAAGKLSSAPALLRASSIVSMAFAKFPLPA